MASFNVEGHTLHSLLNLSIRGEFKDLEGEHLKQLQQSFSNVRYIIIDEMSMVGRKTLGQVDKGLVIDIGDREFSAGLILLPTLVSASYKISYLAVNFPTNGC